MSQRQLRVGWPGLLVGSGLFVQAFSVACGGKVLPLEGTPPVSDAAGVGGGNGRTDGVTPLGEGNGRTDGGTPVGDSTAGGVGTGGTGGPAIDDGASGLTAPPDPVVANGLKLTRIHGEDGGTLAVATFVGDLNGDGLDELAVVDTGRTGPYVTTYDDGRTGPPRSAEVGTLGAVYLFYGRRSFPSSLEAKDADLILRGAWGPITKLGDLDGDGYDDFAFVLQCRGHFDFSASTCPSDGVYVVYGGSERLRGEYLSEAVGLKWSAGPHDVFTVDVRSAGDVNGDGRRDLIVDFLVGDPTSKFTAAGAVILGRTDRAAQCPSRGFADATLTGTSGDSYITIGTAAAGDVDGDGYDDLLVPISDYDALYSNNVSSAPAVRNSLLFYGGPRRFTGTLGPRSGDATWSFAVRGVGALGDLDGDGYADLGLYDPNGQHLWVTYGGAERFHGTYGPERADFSVTTSEWARPAWLNFSGAADMNGDGSLDLMVSDPKAIDQQRGAVALFPGNGTRFSGELVAGPETALVGGIRTNFNAVYPAFEVGSNAALNGDANGDGFADLLVTAGGADPPDGGYAYLVFGGAF